MTMIPLARNVILLTMLMDRSDDRPAFTTRNVSTRVDTDWEKSMDDLLS
jgi:hypothetical protein